MFSQRQQQAGGGDAEDWHEFVQKMDTIFEDEHTAELDDLFGTSLPLSV